ncbi:VacJ family lipoprotein [Acinetobacter courvalinii]|uniref:MlaA family lipoprotein n=1 Tax=Acinetobacter courvalinii TaxID=280147 RepID=UPI0021D3E4CA|nr:VacJ family lipoprotein [Acinetobacter courvalinii]MCU4369509.1 VacJ family lipoprotein [Acinetobacter courvalinii]MCU4447714.1 VacJ family lipoprotein [Acinetobacter courvalinii]
MHYSNFILLGLLTAGACSSVFAQETLTESAAQTATSQAQVTSEQKVSTIQAIKDLKHLTKNDLKVNANAAQPDAVKDPLQPLNRQIYAFNDMLDRNLLKPVAIQYVAKVPEPVRSPYRQFRKNLGEPWNAVNQLIQGRPTRAAKTLGRFTVNTLTTLGFADPARRLGLDTEEESFGVTLGYYGVPSGPYVMLPFFGPSTFRDGFGLAADSFGRPQKYLLDDQEGIYWSTNVLQAVDARSQILDIEESLKGDKYSMIRDFYLQRKAFQISEKRGDSDDVSFVGDADDIDDSSSDEK